jgi:hypothetical protein
MTIDDELLVELWHNSLPATEIARQIGVKADWLKRRWTELVEKGTLPDEPRPINRMMLAKSKPVRWNDGNAPTPDDADAEFLARLEKHHELCPICNGVFEKGQPHHCLEKRKHCLPREE